MTLWSCPFAPKTPSTCLYSPASNTVVSSIRSCPHPILHPETAIFTIANVDFFYLTSLTGLSAQVYDSLASNSTNASTATTVMSALPLPQDIYSVITSVLSLSALSDWIKLFVVGGALETCRRFMFGWWDSFLETFWLEVCFRLGSVLAIASTVLGRRAHG